MLLIAGWFIGDLTTKSRRKIARLQFQFPVHRDSASHAGAMSDKRRLQELFEKYDASGDGVLSEKEMLTLFEHLGIPRAQAEEVFQEADANRDGTIQVHEPLGIENWNHNHHHGLVWTKCWEFNVELTCFIYTYAPWIVMVGLQFFDVLSDAVPLSETMFSAVA